MDLRKIILVFLVSVGLITTHITIHELIHVYDIGWDRVNEVCFLGVGLDGEAGWVYHKPGGDSSELKTYILSYLPTIFFMYVLIFKDAKQQKPKVS